MNDSDDQIVLDAEQIVKTIDRLQQRVFDRFPQSGLHRVCRSLLEVAGQAKQRSQWISRPILGLRLIGWGLVILLILLVLGLFAAGLGLTPRWEPMSLAEFFQTLEAAINDVLLIGAGIFFLMTMERRIKRKRALAAIHELRMIAHLIDMHQLTKDPERMSGTWLQTPHSPKQMMTHFELNRYLDYCSEMLSLTAKVATVYVQKFDDPVALASTNELESLTTGLSRKIWQKIMILRAKDQAVELPKG